MIFSLVHPQYRIIDPPFDKFTLEKKEFFRKTLSYLSYPPFETRQTEFKLREVAIQCKHINFVISGHIVSRLQLVSRQFIQKMFLYFDMTLFTDQEKEECAKTIAAVSNDVKIKADELISNYERYVNPIYYLWYCSFLVKDYLNDCVLELYKYTKDFIECIQNGINLIWTKYRSKVFLDKRYWKGNFSNLFREYDKFSVKPDSFPPIYFGKIIDLQKRADLKGIPIYCTLVEEEETFIIKPHTENCQEIKRLPPFSNFAQF